MARITVEDCLDKVTNRFALVMLVSKRAKQIMRGSKIMVPNKENKPIVSSLREVAAGKVWYDMDLASGSAQDQIEKDLTR
jgi:DNA-directed RNA polymerase subunit omega